MLEVRNLSFGHGPRVLLHDLQLQAHPGEMLAILGPNGAGKTSLLKVLAHVLPARQGSVQLHGIHLHGLSPVERARRIAYLPQHNEVAAVTVFEAVLLGRVPHLGWQVQEADLEQVETILTRLGLTPLAGRSCTTLSGGELQKVLIARALAQEPVLLLLDEPVNHLDLAKQVEVLSLLAATTREHQLITLAVIHDLNLALRFAHRFLLLDGRGNSKTGPMEALSPELVQHSFGLPVTRAQVAGHFLLVPT